MKVVIVSDVPESTKQKIRKSFPAEWSVCIVPPEEAADCMTEANVVIPEHIRVDERFLDGAPELLLVQTGAGYDNVDVAACTRRGVRVCNAAGINAAAVAEHVMAFILCWYKNILLLDRLMKQHGEERQLDYTGAELSGKTVGIIGLGAVGRNVAKYCSAFGMRVLGYSRGPVALPGVQQVELDTLYSESDIVTVHVPLNASTRRMIGREAFAKMKNDALFINTARGGVVEERDLTAALAACEIGGACLDVYEEEPLPLNHPLRELPNVILTPHTAGLPDGVKFHEKRYAFFAGNIERLLRGERPKNQLNFREDLSFRPVPMA